ncbi:Ribonuclease H-like superfamily [Arabidopsis suecica]|uniref:Ribonuclease H-like superfamily n=1 Tax=Arabidopsis suecica TaxID=45249 RepID=A0A8T1ZWW7_ARASU|nr:Ribonuclease H-like superfamily [Arabidopsis suecica]
MVRLVSLIPAQFPRPAKSNGSIIDPSLKVNSLVDSRSNFWNMDLLRELFDPEDVALISALPLGVSTKEDTLGWHYTKSGKYTVKSGYHTTRIEHLDASSKSFGPNIKPLKAYAWKVQCPPKLRHFLWQILSGCVPVTENLRKRDPLEVLRLAEKEAQSWQLAQNELHTDNYGFLDNENRNRVREISLESNYLGYRCFTDGSWKGTDTFSGTGWYCTSSNGEMPTMGAANIRRSLSPLHTEVEALLWAMKCMIGADNQDVAFFTDCSDLVKMVSSPTEWPAFSVYLEDFQSDREEFSSFSLSLIPRSANVKADKLARQVRTEPLHITYVNNIPQEWLF